MAYFLDPEHWTIRGGEAAVKFGDPYTYSFQGQVQRDRSFYLYNVVGDLPPMEARAIVEEYRRLGKLYNWTEILWARHRKNGHIHTARFKVS